MSSIPADLRYTKTHEWVRVLADGSLEVGITDHAQRALGDLVFVETPQPGRRVAAREPYGVVESVKAASDLYSPVAGEVTAVNTELAAAPERINQDPYGAGWIARIRPDAAAGAPSPSAAGPAAGLLSAADYAQRLAAEGD
ncbi:MAG: glycine cleavage system protein GcvH [Steroidobacteraceae bacterium]